MELIRGLHNLRPPHKPCALTIGAFDGVHLGHQRVLRGLIEKARELQLPSTIIVLEPLPREYFAPAEAPPRLMSFREKFMALREVGLDRVLRVRFTQALSEVTARDFIEDIFVGKLGVRYMVVGDDLRFGHDREGDFGLLRELGERHNFQVEDSSTFAIGGERVSSTRIRQALLDDNFELAEQLLGKPYQISGKVIYGKQAGRTLGAPTANIEMHRYRSALAGVYAVQVEGIDGAVLPGVANVGTRPTMGDLVKAILEVHLLGFKGNLYGKTLHVRFLKRLRDERKFPSIDELKIQIHKDIDQAHDFFGLERTLND
ncbi:MAG: bifunctional riboflavin kinase/FAD synthetase [Pseudomonadales bacterium]